MMKITDNRAEAKKLPSMAQSKIPVGTVFFAEDEGSGPYLKVYESVVNLKNPLSTWTRVSRKWDNYQPVEVELLVKENAS